MQCPSPGHENRAKKTAMRIAGFHSFAELLVALYVRNQRAATFWTPVLLINQLLDLASERYEGGRCTSGFVFAGDVPAFLSKMPKHIYTFEPFSTVVHLVPRFFNKPAGWLEAGRAVAPLRELAEALGAVTLPVPITVLNGRAFGPIRPIAEAAGALVTWDTEKNEVRLSLAAPASGNRDAR